MLLIGIVMKWSSVVNPDPCPNGPGFVFSQIPPTLYPVFIEPFVKKVCQPKKEDAKKILTLIV